MIPENLTFGGGASSSIIHPFVLAALIVAAFLMIRLPRKYVVVPFLSFVFLAPFGQQFVIGGAHLYVWRVLILVGWIRFFPNLWRTVSSRPALLSVDSIFLAWAGFHVVSAILLVPGVAVAVNQVGFLWDNVGSFLLLRFLIRDRDDLLRVVKTFAVVAALIAGFMLVEHYTRFNTFGLAGSMPTVPEIRNGRVRAQGPFAHALRAGTVGAAFFPLFLLLWKCKRARILAGIGLVSSAAMTVLCFSSTPLLAYVAGLVAMLLWPLRERLQFVRWGLVVALLGLQVVMKAHVWFLIARVGVVGGSTSWHRAQLIDNFLKNLPDWWLIGTTNFAKWGWFTWDTCNQYVQEGLRGGLGALICFLALITLSFSAIGKARKRVKGDRSEEWRLWLLGLALFVQIVGFVGISFVDQSQFWWFALLAMIVAATAPGQDQKAPNISRSRYVGQYPFACDKAVRERMQFQ